MKYLYLVNIYKNDELIHRMQLFSVGNYRILNKFLCGSTKIAEGEYTVINGKTLVVVVDTELTDKYMEDTVEVVTCENGKRVATHPMANLTSTFNKLLVETFKKDGEGESNLLILSTVVQELVYGHDLFTNYILTDVYASLDCVDEVTGKIKEGFKITVGVTAHEED